MGQRALLQNQGNDNNWLQIKLVGSISNRDGIGSLVSVETNNFIQSRQVTGGVHRVSQNANRLHFGLAHANSVDKIEIIWPSGITQQLSNVGVNTVLTVKEPLVDVAVTCDQIVLHPGEILRPTITLVNTSEINQQVTLVTNVTLVNGSFYPPNPKYLVGPITVQLVPGQSISRTLAHAISNSLSVHGKYTYNVFIGSEIDDIIDESRVDFIIMP